MIDLHYWPTPNGKKVTILLEELGVPYRVVPVNIGAGDQFTPEFLKMNPNHRMPVLVDPEPAGAEGPLVVFESGAIMLYLAEKFGRFWPQDPHGKYEVVQWVMWQMANQGPKLGENGHFRRAGPEAGDLTYARRRFDDEANRLFGVMNQRLYDRRYLAGEAYTIADMICYPWASTWERQGQDINEFKYVKRWLDELAERPAVRRGMDVSPGVEVVDPATLPADEQERRRKLIYNQRARPVSAA